MKDVYLCLSIVFNIFIFFLYLHADCRMGYKVREAERVANLAVFNMNLSDAVQKAYIQKLEAELGR